MRYAFISELYKIAKKDNNVMLLTADLGYTVFENFAKTYPKQFINIGVAEPNMIGIAAGLALSGKKVFAYSISTFATLRTFEQIRNDVCLHNLPVTIIGSGAGFYYSDSGPTHHGQEDLAVLRTLPNITIFSPSDLKETEWATKEAYRIQKPAYIRLSRKSDHIQELNSNLQIGKANIRKGGNDIAIITTGNILGNTIEATSALEKEGFSITLVNMPTLKPFDQKYIQKISKTHKLIVSVEEHTLIGGLGSIISECLIGSNTKLIKIGIKDNFTQVAGDQTYIRNLHGLNTKDIIKNIKKEYKKL